MFSVIYLQCQQLFLVTARRQIAFTQDYQKVTGDMAGNKDKNNRPRRKSPGMKL